MQTSLAYIISTVQTFNSCPGGPDVCQGLVVQTPMDNMAKYELRTSKTHIACESKIRSVVRSGTHGSIHAQETGWLHAHVFNAELNAVTVGMRIVT